MQAPTQFAIGGNRKGITMSNLTAGYIGWNEAAKLNPRLISEKHEGFLPTILNATRYSDILGQGQCLLAVGHITGTDITRGYYIASPTIFYNNEYSWYQEAIKGNRIIHQGYYTLPQSVLEKYLVQQDGPSPRSKYEVIWDRIIARLWHVIDEVNMLYVGFEGSIEEWSMDEPTIELRWEDEKYRFVAWVELREHPELLYNFTVRGWKYLREADIFRPSCEITIRTTSDLKGDGYILSIKNYLIEVITFLRKEE